MLKNDCVPKFIDLEGIIFKDIDIQEDMIRVLVEAAHDVQLCPKCYQLTTKKVDITPKVYRDLDLAGRHCYIEIDLRRFECRECFCTFMEPLSFVAPRRHYTNRFEHQVYLCCQEATASYTALKFGVSDKTAAKICHNIKRYQAQLKPILPIQIIGIEEIYPHKGSKSSVIVISDQSNKKIIEVIKTKKKITLEKYLSGLSQEFKEGIKSVIMDSNAAAYFPIIEVMLPKALCVNNQQYGSHSKQNIFERVKQSNSKVKR